MSEPKTKKTRAPKSEKVTGEKKEKPAKTEKRKKSDFAINDIMEKIDINDTTARHAAIKAQMKSIQEDVDFNKALFTPEIITNRDAKCIRKHSNFAFGSRYNETYNFVDLHPLQAREGSEVDDEGMEAAWPTTPAEMLNDYYDRIYNKEDHTEFLKLIKRTSPKLVTLLKKIEALDKKDMAEHGKLFKHFIFSDTKQGMAGVKLITSGLIASGFFLGYFAEPQMRINKWGKLAIFDDSELQETKGKNVFMLSSGGVYDNPISVVNKKAILAKFNQRPDNVNGKNIRFIVMDSGYKEGIDLFDIKYVHIFEPSVTAADQKQVIGRGTRTCGQKGLEFHPTMGWPLHVFVYDLQFSDPVNKLFGNTSTGMELFLKALNLDVRLLNLTYELENLCIEGSVDYELNKNIHSFSIGSGQLGGASQSGGTRPFLYDPTVTIQRRFGHDEMKDYINNYFKQFSWEKIKMENQCVPKTTKGGAAAELIEYTPTQAFVSNFFTPQNPLKGMLLWHSVGTGKTCTAIATATASFERQGYTILWVTRTTLKNDIWKNMFNQVCHEILKLRIQNEGLVIPSEQSKRMKLLSPAWRVRPMSYKQFSNMVSKQNNIYTSMVKINGELDPLRKTLLIIDEAHKLYGGGDLSTIETPDMPALHNSLMNSYKVSGADSVKLLLMTATPIQFEPMELVKLINLCKEEYEQIPSQFDDFAREYLNDDGHFTKSGKATFLNDIAGHISYLNREKDARQFSQPIIQHVLTDVISKEKLALHNRATRKLVKESKNEVSAIISEKVNNLEEYKKSIDPSNFAVLKKMCSGIKTKKILSKCKKLATTRIKEITQRLKDQVTEVKENIKQLKTEAKGIKFVKNPESDVKMAANSVFHMLAFKCTTQITSIKKAYDHLKNHPEIVQINNEIEHLENVIKEEERVYNNALDNHNARLKEMKKQLKTRGLTLDERLHIKKNINLTAKNYRIENKNLRIAFEGRSKRNKNALKDTKNHHKKTIKSLKKEIDSKMKKSKGDLKELKKEEKKLVKILQKSDAYESEVGDKSVKDVLSTYIDSFNNDIQDFIKMDGDMAGEKEAKAAAKAQKAEEKGAKAAAKEAEKQVKANEKQLKAQTQANAKAEQAAEKARLKAIQDAEKQTSKIEKEAAKAKEKVKQEAEKRAKQEAEKAEKLAKQEADKRAKMEEKERAKQTKKANQKAKVGGGKRHTRKRR
jgi:hypothetical protein